MTVYCVKWIFTYGIIRYEADHELEEDGRVYVVVKRPLMNLLLQLGRDAFRTFEEAQAAAEKMQLKKVNSLEKQLVKLKKMKFDTFKAAN